MGNLLTRDGAYTSLAARQRQRGAEDLRVALGHHREQTPSLSDPVDDATPGPEPTTGATASPAVPSRNLRGADRLRPARAVVDGDWVHVSGTTGCDYATMTISDDVVEQAAQCLRNIEAALAEAKCTFADAVRVRYLLPDRDDFEPCWPLPRRAFGEVRPAATMLMCDLCDPRI